MNDDPTPPSPWTNPPPAAPSQPPSPPPVESRWSGVKAELREHEMLVSVALGMLAGGGAMLLVWALLVILS